MPDKSSIIGRQIKGTTAKRLTRSGRVPKFKGHVKAHKTVIGNEGCYGDGAPFLGNQFTSAKTAMRWQTVIKILGAAAKRGRRAKHKDVVRQYKDLTKRLKYCRLAHFDESGQRLRLIADNSPTEAGQ